MSARDELISVWAGGKPVGVTGAAYPANPTAADKVSAINTWRVPTGTPIRALLEPSAILNTIVPADLAALTQLQVLQFTMLLSGSFVDASPGTTIRAAVQNLFAGKTQTLQALGALVAPFDNPTVEWWRFVGFESPVCLGDAIAAGLS